MMLSTPVREPDWIASASLPYSARTARARAISSSAWSQLISSKRSLPRLPMRFSGRRQAVRIVVHLQRHLRLGADAALELPDPRRCRKY